MDPQLGNMIRNITGLWIMSSLLAILLFLDKRERLQKRGFWWNLTGVVAVTFSIEVGVTICYLWAWHSCTGFILKEDWMNWLAWSIMLIFIIFIIIRIWKVMFFEFFVIILFSMNSGNVENIIFLFPLLKMILLFLLVNFFI